VESSRDQGRLPIWKGLLIGGLVGLVTGTVVGPVVSFVQMNYLIYKYDTAFDGLEFMTSPVIGAYIGVVEGPFVVWLWRIKPPRMNVWWLMVVMASVAGPLALFQLDYQGGAGKHHIGGRSNIFGSLLGWIALALLATLAIALRPVGIKVRDTCRGRLGAANSRPAPLR
jgi:hypothetical protein